MAQVKPLGGRRDWGLVWGALCPVEAEFQLDSIGLNEISQCGCFSGDVAPDGATALEEPPKLRRAQCILSFPTEQKKYKKAIYRRVFVKALLKNRGDITFMTCFAASVRLIFPLSSYSPPSPFFCRPPPPSVRAARVACAMGDRCEMRIAIPSEGREE